MNKLRQSVNVYKHKFYSRKRIGNAPVMFWIPFNMRFQLLLVVLCHIAVEVLGSLDNIVAPVETISRQRRAAVLAATPDLLLIDEPSCTDIRSVCVNLSPHADDLQTLECVQTFLSSQIEALSDDCQHAIWKHTSQLLDDRNVVSIL